MSLKSWLRKKWSLETKTHFSRPFLISLFILIAVNLISCLFPSSLAAGSPFFSADSSAPHSRSAFFATWPGEREKNKGPDWSRFLPLIRKFIHVSQKEWGTPGMAVVIVSQDKVIMADGFGLREAAQNLPVTPRTRFILGSTTKAFTTLALGLLVEEGKLNWDEPVRRYLPEFSLMDEWATLHCTPRDLVTHRTGVPRHDLVWSGSFLGPEEIVRVLRFLEPSRDFRSIYQYNNLMYIAAGVLVSRVAGISWEDFLHERIFSPLSMKNSGCTLNEYLASAEYSYSYTRQGEKVEAIPFPVPEQKIMYGPRASGSVHATAEDMGQWLRFHLSGGEVDGRRLISEERLQEMHSPQIVRPASPAELPDIEHQSYGLGWMIDSYRGHYRIHHGGSTMGFSSFVVFFPREKFGAAILTNLNSPLATLIGNYISDLALGLIPIDWKKRLASRPALPSAPKPAPSFEAKLLRPFREYTGAFTHPAYGQLSIETEEGKLWLHFRREKIELEPIGYDLFRPKEASWRRFTLRFISNHQGAIEGVGLPLEPAVKEIVFVRQDSKTGN